MTENDYPTYQWSIFVGQGNKQQFVYRNENWDTFIAEVKKIKLAIEGLEQKNGVVTQETTEPSGLTSMCASHGIPMQEGFSKRTNKPYWFHKSEAGAMCFGKGYQDKR